MAARKLDTTRSQRMLQDAIDDGSAIKMDVSIRELTTPHVDQTFQVRVERIDVEHVRRLDQMERAIGPLWRPVVSRKPRSMKRWRVVDGFHRVQMAIARHLESIPAYVVDWDEAKLWDFVVGCNSLTVKPWSGLDRKNAVMKYLGVNDNHLRSINSIREACCVSEKLAKDCWLEFCKARGIEPPATLIGIDGGSRIVTPEPSRPTPKRTDPRLRPDARIEVPSPARGMDRPHDRKTCPTCNGTGTVPADTTN